MRRSILFPALGLAGLLCACPGNYQIDPPPPPKLVRQLGTVFIGVNTNDEGDYKVYGAGALFLPVARSVEDLETVRDRCFVNDIPPLLPDEAYATLRDAGEFVYIRSNGQRFLPLTRLHFEGGGYGYSAGEFLEPIAYPEGEITVTVPGAAFPAFDDVVFPELPPPPVVLKGEAVTMTADGSFTWEPYEAKELVSYIDFQVFSDPEKTPFIQAECIAADDGEFSFPSEIRQQIRDLDPDFEGRVSSLDRSVYRLEVAPDGETALATGLGDLPVPLIRP